VLEQVSSSMIIEENEKRNNLAYNTIKQHKKSNTLGKQEEDSTEENFLKTVN
jgi:hypothetical protein